MDTLLLSFVTFAPAVAALILLVVARGEDAAAAAEATARETFAGGAGGNLPTLSVGDGMGLPAALSALGFTASNKEAKRKIEEGAVRVNGEKVQSFEFMVKAGDKVSLGQKKHGLVLAED